MWSLANGCSRTSTTPTAPSLGHKARWVVRGFSQQAGVDYDEIFNPVVKPTTIRTVLSIAASRAWPIYLWM
jgi:histone deacetylase 1/2